jgi:hypothetical protein
VEAVYQKQLRRASKILSFPSPRFYARPHKPGDGLRSAHAKALRNYITSFFTIQTITSRVR